MGEQIQTAPTTQPAGIRVEEVACILGISPRSVQNMASRGEIPSARLRNGSWRFNERVVRQWLNGLVRAHALYGAQLRIQKAEAKLVSAEQIAEAAKPFPRRICGVYFLLRRGRVVYVGQSRDIGGRVASHLREKVFDAWYWVKCEPNMLNATERAYINALNPPLNRDVVTIHTRLAKKVIPAVEVGSDE